MTRARDLSRLANSNVVSVNSGGFVGIGSTIPDSKLDVDGSLQVTGLSTISNVTVGNGTTELIVTGDARITGILTIGTSSVTLDGTNNQVNVGSGITIHHTNGIQVGENILHSSGLTINSSTIAGITSSISDTAVDVFVYDTSKDSDGGAWRKRTQHTSWYNETLNTATRGSRREFPAVAVIVAEATQVTIYDGDDPDLPMWMEFISTSGQYGAIYNGRSLISVVAKNGEINLADNVDSVLRWNFITDTIKSESSSGRWNSNRNIAGRNPSDSTSLWKNYDSAALVGYPLNDVAMTVLPNAPIDDATGLPVPTIAVATDGGVSVIRDDGTVVDITQNHAQTTTVGTVVFDSKTNNILFTTDYSSGTPTTQHYKINAAPIPSSDAAATTNYYRGFQDHTYKIQSAGNVTTPKLIGYEIEDIVDMGGNGLFAVRTTTSSLYGSGLNIFKEYPGSTNTDNSIITYISSNYNTGWMHGDIKGAFLSDTDATNVTGSELVTNGTFDSDVSGWTAVNGTITYSSGTAVVNRTGGIGPVAYQTITTVVGETYVLSGTVDSTGTGDRGDIRAYSDNGSTLLVSASGTDNQTVTVSGTFTATTTTTYIYFTIDNTGTATFDNVSVRIAELDRSVNNKGLAVYGTITKSAVATGAELVAYSGFDNLTSYLMQPYNSDLELGSGDISFSVWIYPTAYTSYPYVFARGNNLYLYLNNDGTIRVRLGSNLSSASVVPTNTWSCVTAVRRSGTITIYLNGKRLESGASTIDITAVDTPMYIGVAYDRLNEFYGKISLLRISASAPSDEQIKKIYEDEKVLFQENAKCTLYGSSDAVTALAYDDSTNILYAGTSSGRSDFQGLRRINNTTTAVTTAMSASNGLVAEQ